MDMFTYRSFSDFLTSVFPVGLNYRFDQRDVGLVIQQFSLDLKIFKQDLFGLCCKFSVICPSNLVNSEANTTFFHLRMGHTISDLLSLIFTLSFLIHLHICESPVLMGGTSHTICQFGSWHRCK